MKKTIAADSALVRKGSIVFVVPTLSGGGAERVVCTLIHHFNQKKFESVYLVVLDMKSAVYTEFPSFVTLIDLQCTRVRYSFLKLARLLWRLRPDIVFSTLNNLNLFLAAIRSFLPRAYYIGRESSIVSYANEYFGNTSLRRYLCRRLYPRLDKIICQSKFMADDLCEKFGVSRDKISVIYNPVDRDKINLVMRQSPSVFQFHRNFDLTLVAVGRLSSEKGFDLLIESLFELREFSVHLAIVGDGEEKERLQQLARNRSNPSHLIEFLGFHLDPYHIMKGADYFVLSSRFEGLPNAVLESLACGTPVVAVPSPGGLREVVFDGVNGFVAEEVSAPALAMAIRRGYKALRSGIGISGNDLFPDVCKLELVIRQYDHILNQAVISLDAL